MCGVVALRPGVSLKDMTIQDLYLDIGAKNEAHARRLVQVGDTAVSRMPSFTTETKLVSPYLDNRISCAAMLDALSHIRAYTNDLYFVFTVQEELGLRGSKPAAYSIDPDYGIAVDVTVGETWDDPKKGSSIPVSYTHLDVYKRQVYFLPACLRFGSKKSGQNWKKLTVSPPPQSSPCIMTCNCLLSHRKPVCQKGTPVSKSETGAFFYHHSIPACFLRALNEVSLITCSILQASSVAVASSTPRVIRNCANKVCFS